MKTPLLAIMLLVASSIIPTAAADEEETFCTTPIFMGLQPCLVDKGHDDPDVCTSSQTNSMDTAYFGVRLNRANTPSEEDAIEVLYAEQCGSDGFRWQGVVLIDDSGYIVPNTVSAGVVCEYDPGSQGNTCWVIVLAGVGVTTKNTGDLIVWVPFPWGQIIP